MSTINKPKINPLPFYAEWAGHPLPDLTIVHSVFRANRHDKPIIWLAGDSSLDNKAWIPSSGPGGEPLPAAVPDIYSTFLDPVKPKPDVSFWLNDYLRDAATCLNAAVEATTLRERDWRLLAHDEFVRNHIQPQDIVIVSVGANDIALSPTATTMRHMAQLAWLTPRRSIEGGSASSLTHFKHMFGPQTQDYVSRLVEKRKPRAVIVCTIYYPLEASAGAQPGWAETQLKMLGYNSNPGQLQAAIKKMYEQATSTIRIEGTTVIPCALFEAMDGKMKEDYTARVEPSVQGGKKMAGLLHGHLSDILSSPK